MLDGQRSTKHPVVVVCSGSYGFVNYLHHAEAVHAIVAMNGHTIGDKAVNCAWGRHQPRQIHPPAIQMLQMQPQMQSPMQNQLGFVAAQGMLTLMRPMIQMPAGLQMPNQPLNVGVPQLASPQLAQQALRQQAFLNSSLPLGGQLSTPLTSQQHIMAARRAQNDPNSSLYFNMYGGMYGAP